MSQAIDAGLATSSQLSQAVRETKGDELGKSDFLLLLVTQFQNQDPLNPMDDKEFVAQLSQFSSLEQLMNLNTGMDGLTAATKEQQIMNAASYIGKEVEAGGNSIAKGSDGAISAFYYAVGENMAKGTIYVYDQNMNQIYGEALGPMAAGSDKFVWSGRDYTGAEALPGVYYVRMSAEDANGETILIDSAVTGRVDRVRTYEGETYLTLTDGRSVALSDVRAIAGNAPGGTSGGTTETNNAGTASS